MVDYTVMTDYTIRPAIKADCLTIAKLYSISSDGVADYIWTQLAKPGDDILTVGQHRYEEEHSNFSYRNCLVVEVEQNIAGMMVAFPITNPESDESLAGKDADPVLAPYADLEEYDSYYICGIAFFPEYRGLGIGKKLMAMAENKCRELGFNRLSLVVFDQNVGAKKLYLALGYKTVMTANVVAHPLIHLTGVASLMVKKLEDN